jgi:hypothetical protein
MFVSANQIYVFLACVAFGGVVGVFFSVSSLLKSLIKIKWIKVIVEVLVFILVAVLYLLYSYNMHFPNLRLYMIGGVLVGITAYLKSFHIMLAKFLKKAYNIIKRKKAIDRNDRG